MQRDSSVSASCRWVNSTYCILDQLSVSANPYSRLPLQLPKWPQSICAARPARSRTAQTPAPGPRSATAPPRPLPARIHRHSRASVSPRTAALRSALQAPSAREDRRGTDPACSFSACAHTSAVPLAGTCALSFGPYPAVGRSRSHSTRRDVASVSP